MKRLFAACLAAIACTTDTMARPVAD